MRFQRKTILGGLVMITLLLISATSCSKAEIATSPYIHDIVPSQQEPAFWYLSPEGDKLLYNTISDGKQAIIRFLTTGQEFTIADCFQFQWLNNESVYCYKHNDLNHAPSGIISNISSNVIDLQKIPIKSVTMQQAELEELLKQTGVIYRLTPSTKPDSLLALKGQQEYYHITGFENLDTLLENYIYTIIPLHDRLKLKISEPVYSPNGEYYYLLQDSNLEIYDATSYELLVKFKPFSGTGFPYRIGGDFPNRSEGWAADSSGIYFQAGSGLSGLRHSPPPVQPIQKLCVPGTLDCPSVN